MVITLRLLVLYSERQKDVLRPRYGCSKQTNKLSARLIHVCLALFGIMGSRKKCSSNL